MNAMPDSKYRDEAVADVADAFNKLAPQDFGEPTAHLTADEERQWQHACRYGEAEKLGHLYMTGLDRWREHYMTSDSGEKAIQERILELAEDQ